MQERAAKPQERLPLFEVIELSEPRYFLGLSVKTDEKGHFKDAQELAKRFVEAREKIKGLAYPYVSVTMTGKKDAQRAFDYFSGEEVEAKAKTHGLEAFKLNPGRYARIKVKRNPTWLLAMRLAKARQHFHQVYLPQSGYALGEGFEEVEIWERAEEDKPKGQQSVTLLIPLVN